MRRRKRENRREEIEPNNILLIRRNDECWWRSAFGIRHLTVALRCVNSFGARVSSTHLLRFVCLHLAENKVFKAENFFLQKYFYRQTIKWNEFDWFQFLLIRLKRRDLFIKSKYSIQFKFDSNQLLFARFRKTRHYCSSRGAAASIAHIVDCVFFFCKRKRKGWGGRRGEYIIQNLLHLFLCFFFWNFILLYFLHFN